MLTQGKKIFSHRIEIYIDSRDKINKNKTGKTKSIGGYKMCIFNITNKRRWKG